MSHVSTILLYNFEAFYWTNLLIRCPEPIPCFLLFCISENLLQENSSELDENLQELFLCQDEDGVRRETQGATHSSGATSIRGPGVTSGWDPPLRLELPLIPL